MIKFYDHKKKWPSNYCRKIKKSENDSNIIEIVIVNELDITLTLVKVNLLASALILSMEA